MEQLNHRNDIEIKLLPNRRFIYSNRRQNIVITAEHLATDITVLFPEEYEHYSKRVDFVNSHGKEWTEGLYTPEYKHKKYPHGFNKCRFHFSLPTEVTTEGELKMQFLAYKPDKSMVTVPFEIVTLDVLNGVLAFKKNARSNPDLLILSANQSTEALFNSQRAVAKSEKADKQSQKAVEKADRTAVDLETETARAVQAEADIAAALDAESARAQSAETDLTAAIQDEAQARIIGDNANSEAIEAESVRATQAEEDIAAALDSEIVERQAAIEAEAQERIAGDEANAQAVAAESDRAIQAESEITAALNREINEREAAVEAEVQARIEGDNETASAITAEVERAQNTESDLAASIEAEMARATAAEETNAQAIESEQSRAVAAENEIAVNLGAEIQRAENDLMVALNAEAVERTQGDADNTAAIEAESARAMYSEAALAADVANETTRAQVAEQHNFDAINAETDRAQNTENILRADISAEVSRAAAAESGLQSSIAAEEARALSAEAVLRADINTEVIRAQAAEQQNAAATIAEETRAIQAEIALGERIDAEIPAALSEAKAYTDQVAEQVRVDGTVYKGTITESELPPSAENGDLYWISDFNLTLPDHSGSAIWSGTAQAWDYNIDRYKHQDDDTIVARDSDGALKVADTNEINLTPDAADFGAVVQLGFKAIVRSIIRKIKGLFQKSADNAAAIASEASRAQTMESSLSSSISEERTRAQAAEHINEIAIAAEVSRATAIESDLSLSIAQETARAQSVEQTISSAVTSETTRAQSSESGLAIMISAEEARAQAAEQANFDAVSTEQTRAQNAENGLFGTMAAEESARIAGDSINAQAIAAEQTRAQTVEAGKVDKISGKGLSSEDYTTSDKQKLASIEKNHAKPTVEYGAASKANYGHVKFYGNASGDSTEQLVNPTSEHYYNSAFNCNDYRTAGRIYQNHDRSGSGATVNGPLGNALDRFCLEVYTIPGDTTTVMQRYVSMRNGREFIRRYRDSAWGAWEEIAFTSAIPTSPAALGAEPAFAKSTAFNKNFGETAGMVCEGNDYRLSNTRTPASHTSTGATYGAGDPTYYGHVKLSAAEGMTTLPSGDTALKYNYSTAASNIDLNTYIYEGRYTLYNVPTNITDSVNHFPSGWDTGNLNYNTAYLEVRRFFSNSEIHQTLFKRRTTERWVRVLTGGTWSAWTEIDTNNKEIPLTFSNINAGVTGVSGHYFKESAAHGRLMIRFTTTASVSYWTKLFTITNAEVPRLNQNRPGFLINMGQSSFNGATFHAVSMQCLNNELYVICSQNLTAGWDFTVTIFI